MRQEANRRVCKSVPCCEDPLPSLRSQRHQHVSVFRCSSKGNHGGGFHRHTKRRITERDRKQNIAAPPSRPSLCCRLSHCEAPSPCRLCAPSLFRTSSSTSPKPRVSSATSVSSEVYTVVQPSSLPPSLLGFGGTSVASNPAAPLSNNGIRSFGNLRDFGILQREQHARPYTKKLCIPHESCYGTMTNRPTHRPQPFRSFGVGAPCSTFLW